MTRTTILYSLIDHSSRNIIWIRNGTDEVIKRKTKTRAEED